MLQNKNAVIYGAGGSLGGAVARALANAGAKVFLSGHHIDSVKKTANAIIASGGKAEADEVDALDEKQVNSYVDSVLRRAGTIDISFDAISYDPVQNIPLTDMAVDDFVRPVNRAMRTQFLTATAAARVMMQQRSGVILSLTATPGGIGYPRTGGFAPACCAMECFSSNLAAELGIYGVRVVNIRSGGSPDSKVFADAIERIPETMEQVLKEMKGDTMLKSMPLMADIANVAVFLCSDGARAITGVTVDATCGTTAGLNYKMHAQTWEAGLAGDTLISG